MKVENIKITTDDGLILHSHLFKSESKKIVIYVHGFESDFFGLPFVNVIGEKLSHSNINFLAIQTRGTAQRMEFLTTDGDAKYIGSHMEVLEEAFLDIDGFVKWAKGAGYQEIYLAGHSLGTIKAVRYINEGKFQSEISRLLLLAPFDKNGQEDLVTLSQWNQYVKQAWDEINAGHGRSYIPSNWEEVEMSYQTFYSWYRPSELGSMFDFYKKGYDFPTLRAIRIPTTIIVGDKDEFFHGTNMDNPEEAMEILLSNIPNSTGHFLKGCQHIYLGYEAELAEFVLKFCAP